MRLTPNLSLIVWDQNNDEFSSTQLAANWDAIDAQFGLSSVDVRPSRFLESGATLPVASLTNGRMFYLTATDQGIPANTVCKYDGTSWKAVGRPEILSSLPVTGNYAGRMVVLSAANGGFGAWNVVVYDGSAWQIVGGIGVFATVPVTNNYAGRLAVVTADPGFPPYSLIVFNGSSYSRVEKRGVEVVGALPGSPYAGQVVILNAVVAPFRAWDVVRYNGSSWGKVGGGTVVGTTLPTSPSDGDTFVFQADVTNGVNWRFQYNASSASAYKWEFVGGSELLVAINTPEAPGSWNTWVDLATVGPSWTVPVGITNGGDFDLGWGANAQGNTQQYNTNIRLSVWAGTSSQLSSREAVVFAQNQRAAITQREVISAVNAGTELRVRYRVDQGGSSGIRATQDSRWLSIRPVRVG